MQIAHLALTLKGLKRRRKYFPTRSRKDRGKFNTRAPIAAPDLCALTSPFWVNLFLAGLHRPTTLSPDISHNV